MSWATDVGVGWAADVTEVAVETGDALGARVTDGSAEPRALRELCHDLIEAAASIRLLAHAASTQVRSNTPARESLQLIAKETRNISDICDYVLGDPRRISPIRLDALAAEAAASARLRYSGVIDTDLRPVALHVHPAVIVRILTNLLANACRAAGPGGRVRLVVALEEGQAQIFVADSGAGLGQEKAGRASLGLEIIGKLALSCGGTVRMSVSDLGGLCVAVTLPCPAPAPPATEPPVTEHSREKVVIPGPALEVGSLPG